MSKHKMRATIPHGNPDIGAEIECDIVFNFTPGTAPILYPPDNADPGYPDCIELVSVRAGVGAFQDLHQKHLEEVVSDWLQDAGYERALSVAAEDEEFAREYAAELKADR